MSLGDCTCSGEWEPNSFGQGEGTFRVIRSESCSFHSKRDACDLGSYFVNGDGERVYLIAGCAQPGNCVCPVPNRTKGSRDDA